MSYVDGFIVPVPTGNKQAYFDLATKAAELFKAHGALKVVECWESDVPSGKVTDFRRAVQAEAGESIVFSWIIWPSKAVRDEGTKRVMEHFPGPADMPFDGRRMIFGGFDVLLESGTP